MTVIAARKQGFLWNIWNLRTVDSNADAVFRAPKSLSMSTLVQTIAGGSKSEKSEKSSKSSKSSPTSAPTTTPGSLVSSWVQYTGSDAMIGGCTRDNGADSCDFKAEVRAIFDDPAHELTDCPSDILEIDGENIPMSLRIDAEEYFSNIVCYAKLPTEREVSSIVLGGEALPAPVFDPKEVVIIGDSGCRMGTAHGGLYQSCNNPALWPFARVSQSVLEEQDTDLIIHTGDYIYREGPCLNGIAGCKDSPYYDKNKHQNFDVWFADWFEPAQYINKAAPLLLIRGNHETCSRAGQGWFRYLHHGEEKYCKDSPFGKGVQPWLVDFKSFQVGILDTSTMPNDPTNPNDPVNITGTIREYAAQLDILGTHLSKPSLLGTHYPAWGWGSSDGDIEGETQIEIVRTMQAIVNTTRTGQMPAIFDLLLAAHVHLAQVTSFVEEGQAAQLVVANSGTQFIAPVDAPTVIGTLHVKETYALYQYGYLKMTNLKASEGEDLTTGWSMAFKDRMGITLNTCSLEGKDVSCSDVTVEE